MQRDITKAIREIHTSTADPDLKEQALEHVRAAQADPTPDKLTKAIGFLGKIEAVTAKVAGVGTSITTLGTLAEVDCEAGRLFLSQGDDALRDYRITSSPFRRITFSRTSAGPVGCFAPRSSCET